MTIYTYRLSIYDDSNLLIIRHSRSYGDFTKKISPHLVSLIMVEGLFSPYIVTNFDIVNNSESLVQRYVQLVPSFDEINQFS